MKVKIDRSFEKDTDKLHNQILLQKIAVCIEQVVAAKSADEIHNLKKLKGFRNYFRIKIGDYRAGILIY